MRLAFALSLGAAVSLGITRFSYGLLLPPMREDLGWSYTLAGSMNTANAAGYLLGALMTPILMWRFGPVRLLVGRAPGHPAAFARGPSAWAVLRRHGPWHHALGAAGACGAAGRD